MKQLCFAKGAKTFSDNGEAARGASGKRAVVRNTV